MKAQDIKIVGSITPQLSFIFLLLFVIICTELYKSASARGGHNGLLAMNGLGVKHSRNGVAAASYWLMGGRPGISSMVRNTPAVAYMLCTGVFRLV